MDGEEWRGKRRRGGIKRAKMEEGRGLRDEGKEGGKRRRERRGGDGGKEGGISWIKNSWFM